MNTVIHITDIVIDQYVGHRLRQARLSIGLSQEKLARAVDITFQQIQKYENGKNRISASRLYKFAQILKVSVLYFYGGLENSVEEESEPSAIDLNIARCCGKIKNPVLKKNLEQLIEMLAEQNS